VFFETQCSRTMQAAGPFQLCHFNEDQKYLWNIV